MAVPLVYVLHSNNFRLICFVLNVLHSKAVRHKMCPLNNSFIHKSCSSKKLKMFELSIHRDEEKSNII